MAAIGDEAELVVLDDFFQSAECQIHDRVSLMSVGRATLEPLETRCAIALRLAMWERHTLQPAAEATFGAGIKTIRQIGSYNCRRIRTPDGNSSQMSTHATADAIDITGFDLTDGRRIRLTSGWNGEPDEAEFLRDARDGACRWFKAVLSPDFNALHDDHFHLQSRGWRTCR